MKNKVLQMESKIFKKAERIIRLVEQRTPIGGTSVGDILADLADATRFLSGEYMRTLEVLKDHGIKPKDEEVTLWDTLETPVLEIEIDLGAVAEFSSLEAELHKDVEDIKTSCDEDSCKIYLKMPLKINIVKTNVEM